jgi:hypothetical protein
MVKGTFTVLQVVKFDITFGKLSPAERDLCHKGITAFATVDTLRSGNGRYIFLMEMDKSEQLISWLKDAGFHWTNEGDE